MPSRSARRARQLLDAVLVAALLHAATSSQLHQATTSSHPYQLPALGFFEVPLTLALRSAAQRTPEDDAARTEESHLLRAQRTEGLTADLSHNLTLRLVEVLQSVSGFVAVLPVPHLDFYSYGSSDDVMAVTSRLLFNKTALNERRMLSAHSHFLAQLEAAFTRVADTVGGWGSPLGGFLREWGAHTEVCQYGLDKGNTATINQNYIDNMYVQLNSSEWLCGASLCENVSDSCYLNLTGEQLICVSKCTQFETLTRCTDPPSVPGVYLQGVCRLDAFYYPYCDCGNSAGDVMSNFYDGVQCVSVTFIVAMSASGGALLLLLIVVLIVIARVQRQALLRAAARLEKYNAGPGRYTNKERAAVSDPTLDAIMASGTHRVDSTKARPESSDDVTLGVYDGADLYPYLRKEITHPLSPSVMAQPANHSLAQQF